jgi:hypothetical protein
MLTLEERDELVKALKNGETFVSDSAYWKGCDYGPAAAIP